MPIPFNKMFFAQNVMPIPLPEPPDTDPGDPDLSGCAIDTSTHPRWNDAGHNHYGSDWFGFKALPGGIRRQDGIFLSIGNYGSWWSSTEGSSASAWYRFMIHDIGSVGRNRNFKRLGFGVRCVRNETVGEASDPDGTVYTDDYTDGSGNKYDGVKIGNQVWTKKNLITTKYQNESNITTGLNNAQWEAATNGAYAIYPHADVDGIASEQAMIDAYGILYNWYAVDNGLVTGAYRVPSDNDWTDLTDYLILQYDLSISNVAMVLKSCRQVNHPLA